MSILIDPPRWPAHGTLFSHLISDTSVLELHQFASRLGIRQRAFDRDHYDVPQERYNEFVAAGAREVSGSDLVRVLVRSGLRIPARFRPERLNPALLKRWERTLPGQRALAEDLLLRWSQEHRHYHDRVHLLSVLESLDWLCGTQIEAQERQILELAAWFHDAVYEGTTEDERKSADLAAISLQGLISDKALTKVQQLILLTIEHRPAEGDLLGELLSDADLEVLARPAKAYQRYAKAVRDEYDHVPAADFARGRAGILQELLLKDRLYCTVPAQERWESQARANLEAELHQLLLQV
ncbi:DUF4031 domain-containing protein [Glutamicibacter arilaitensis]|uniref:DUF4031 domain-containing protein n=1 Tax=Glutamicibacter arilaitensis TaxID=256701 RepID=UPI0038514107